MSSRRLKRNAVHCAHCNTTIESKHVHDFVTCSCPPDSQTRVFVDGGLDYRRLGFGDNAMFKDLVEYKEENES